MKTFSITVENDADINVVRKTLTPSQACVVDAIVDRAIHELRCSGMFVPTYESRKMIDFELALMKFVKG